MKGKFRRQDAEDIGRQVAEALKDTCREVEVAGSVRRKREVVGDVDVVAVPFDDDASVPMRVLQDEFGAPEGGKVQTSFMVSLNASEEEIQVDVWFVPRKSWGAALLFVTGSARFNIGCRTLAKQRGYKLSRYALVRRYDESAVVAQELEDDVLVALGLKFVPPEERSVETLKEFYDLVKRYDLKSDSGSKETARAALLGDS